MQYCGHLLQIDVPAKVPIVLCAVDMLNKLKNYRKREIYLEEK